MSYKDPEKQREWQAKRWQQIRDVPKVLEKRKAARLRHTQKRQNWLNAIKQPLACADCDFSFQQRPECCDFHHPDPAAKDGSVSELMRGSKYRQLDAVLAEIEKCIPLCANCHRTRHVKPH